jgi:excinuclease UvrABC nuclease subunit
MKFQAIKNGGRFEPWVNETKGKSGVYIIKENTIVGHVFGTVLYVGESHTGKLYSTMTRHFQRWKGETAGPVYNPENVVVQVILTEAADALEMQNDAIANLLPRDNVKANPLKDSDA